MKSIIDTPEFKRLHHLRQIGAAFLVFPSANHTRFEHSIGVSHLAGKIMKNLQVNQSELEITDRLIELVRIAGLVHDIGHGPFSHLYDDIITEYGFPHHEKRGITIFTSMINKYNIKLEEEEINMIIEMIDPSDETKDNYIYQIVANKISSVDVDKIDYIQRDSYHLGLSVNNYDRLINMARVVKYNDKVQLAWPEKIQQDILTLFETRYRLHKNVYYHHAVKSAEFIIKEILINIIEDPKNKILLNMSNDMIIYQNNTKETIKLLDNLNMRKFPKIIGEKVLCCTSTKENLKKVKSFEAKLDKLIIKLNSVNIKNTGWKKFTIGFISGNGENPLKNVIYFNQKNINSGFTLQHYNSFMEPKNYKEFIYRVYIHDKKDFVYAENQWSQLVS
tara:strand:- start:8487 stop:9659 length:1173 start_codon:yes stop_codon:yes gene_type:complete